MQQPIASPSTYATWCKGGCGKFRYIASSLEGKPICSDCTARLGLQPKDNAFWRLNLKTKPTAFVNKPKTIVRTLRFSLPYYQLQIFGYQMALLVLSMLWLKVALNPRRIRRIQKSHIASARKTNLELATKMLLASVAIQPRACIDLRQELQLSAYKLGKITQDLIARGELICEAENSSRHARIYSLPSQNQELKLASGVHIKDLLIGAITEKPRSTLELHQLFPQFQYNWIRCLLSKLHRQGRLSLIGDNICRVYALPNTDLPKSVWIIREPTNAAILALIKSNPKIWGREIARILKKPPKTIFNRLRLLEEYRLISSQVQGTRKVYSCANNQNHHRHTTIPQAIASTQPDLVLVGE